MYPRHDNGVDEYDQIDGDEGIYLTARAPLLFGETASSGGLKLIRTSDHLIHITRRGVRNFRPGSHANVTKE